MATCEVAKADLVLCTLKKINTNLSFFSVSYTNMKSLYVEDVLTRIGQEVELRGWVNTKRDHKKIVF